MSRPMTYPMGTLEVGEVGVVMHSVVVDAQSDALREKVARAIMLHHDIDPDVFIGMHGGYDHWLNAADAALAAINEIPRQPTQSDALREENERLRALLARTVNLAEVYAEGTGTNFKEAMAEARAALQEQSK